MIWSVQLTPWALPLLLAVLVVLRDAGFLWPRRRERGAAALLVLAGTAGLWATVQLVGVTGVGLDFKVWTARVAYLPAAAAPAVWAWFGLTFVRRRRALAEWPMLLLYAASLTTALLALWSPEGGILIRGAALVERGPAGGLTLDHGFWHWIHLLVRAGAILAATGVLARHLARASGSRLRSVAVVAAAVVALAPVVHRLGTRPEAWWRDLSPAGFALASAILGWGLLRHRLLGLGPAARTLVMEELRDPVVVLDEKGRIVDVNREAERVLGLEPYGTVPLRLGTLWASSRQETGRVHRITLDAVAEREGEREERTFEERTFEVKITPLDAGGAEGRSALVLRDVTDRERMERELRETSRALRDANAELERLANTDPLTGLANRRHFMEGLARELDRSDRYEHPLSLVVLDLDRFKSVNDTHGHAAGDAVLRSAGRTLESVCREVDLPARTGGEEMALLLPETDREGARAVAERVRTRIERTEHTSPDGESFGVTASVGVAEAGPSARTPEQLLRRADEALYRAKEKGRNRVVVAS